MRVVGGEGQLILLQVPLIPGLSFKLQGPAGINNHVWAIIHSTVLFAPVLFQMEGRVGNIGEPEPDEGHQRLSLLERDLRVPHQLRSGLTPGN